MPNNWISVSVLPPLKEDEVHLWRIELEQSPGLVDHCASLLSADEQTIANRFRLRQAKDHFTIGRGCLRTLLGNALGQHPSHASFVKGPHGKPELTAIDGQIVSFNIAHSQNTVLIALARQGAVGVDVEYLDRSTDIMEVARGNFTQNESSFLASIADPKTRLKTFFTYWTRKEAIGKADGRGLLLPMTSFDVSSESMNSHPIHVNEPSKENKLYFVSDINLGDRVAGALAFDSSDCSIRRLIFPPVSLR